MEVPYLEREEIRGAARELCRRALGTPPTHPTNLATIVFDYLYEEHGVAFYNDRSLGREDEDDVLGITYPVRNEIHVDRRLAESGHRGRYRFTVAHEIGHWTLHRPLFLDGDGRDDPDARIVTLQRDVVESDGDYRPEEWQANYFAIWLLLGDDALRREFEHRFPEPPLSPPPVLYAGEAGDPLRHYSRALAATAKDGHPPLNETFLLSIEATAIALEERGYVTDR